MSGCGVELTATAVRGVLFERVGGGVRCVAAHEVPCDGADADALTRALSFLRRTLRLTQPVVLAVPQHASLVLTVDPLVPNPRKAALAVEFELQQHLPFDIADASWHHGWLAAAGRGTTNGGGVAQAAPMRARPDGTGALVAAVRRQLIDDRLAACRRAGLAVQAVTVSSVGVLNAYVAAHPPGEVVLARFTGPMTAEWIVAAGSRISVLTVAASSAETLPEEFRASWEAIGLDAAPVAKPVTLIEPPDWARQMAFGGALPQVWTGDEIFRSARTRLERPERFLGAAGLAIQSLRTAAYPLNLVADAQGAAVDARIRRIAMAATGLCVAAGLALAASGMLELQRRKVRVLELLERRERLYQTLRPEIRQLLQQQEQVEARAAQLERLAASGAGLVGAMAQVADALPETVWLTRLECATDAGMEIQVEGRATTFQDVTKFLDHVKSIPGITSVKPLSTTVTTDEATGKELVSFAAQLQRGSVP